MGVWHPLPHQLTVRYRLPAGAVLQPILLQPQVQHVEGAVGTQVMCCRLRPAQA